MTIRSFDMNFVAITLGSFPFSGFADGDACTIAFGGDDWEVVQGSDGEVLYVRKNNAVAEVTLRLAQGNPLIDQTKILHKTSLAAGGLVWPFAAANLKGTDNVTGNLMIMKYPDLKFSDSAQPVEIKGSLTVDQFVGGTGFPLL